MIDASAVEVAAVRDEAVDLRKGLQDIRVVQSKVLEKQDDSEDQLSPWLKKLDAANFRLKETMDDLRSTMVHSSLRPSEEGDTNKSRSLLSFIDEAGVEGVRRNVYAAIDEAKSIRPQLIESTTPFLDILVDIEGQDQIILRELGALQAIPDEFPSILDALEQGAAVIADDLESLVKHYDLCMTAFRYTENFTEAAKTISLDPPPDLPDGMALENNMAKSLESMSEADRREMLQIVAKDASEVDDCVSGIQDHVIEMEEQMDRIEGYFTSTKELRKVANQAMDQVDRAKGLASVAEAAALQFDHDWRDLDGLFAGHLDELDSLSEVYIGFLTAYDGLIVEVARRGHAKQQRQKVVANATRALEQLYIQELGERDAFRERHGDSLPTDLWAGLMDRPLKFVVSQAKDDGLPIPELPRDIVDAAAKRLGRPT